MTTERHLDVIALGRLALDLYAQQRGARLEDATSFAKYRKQGGAVIIFNLNSEVEVQRSA